jgi:hypothetical protein
MTLFYKPYHAGLLAITLLTSGTATSFASTVFSGSASFTLTPASAVEFVGIDISYAGGFVDNGSVTTGDALLNPAFVFLTPETGLFSVSGSVNEGEVYSRHNANFEVSFANNSTVSRSLSFTLGYILDATASGEFANSVVQLSYGNQGYGEVEVNQFNNHLNIVGNSGDEFLNIILAANSSYTLNLNVGVAGDLLGTTPVPLPPAAWPFLLGIAGLAGLLKKV